MKMELRRVRLSERPAGGLGVATCALHLLSHQRRGLKKHLKRESDKAFLDMF